MKLIDKALRELKLSLLIVNLVSIFVDSLIILLICVLLSMIIGFHWVYSVVPFIGFLVYRLLKFYQAHLLRKVETKVPQLKEILRTAADNSKSEYEIVKMLHEDVVMGMKNVKTSYFVNFSDLFLRLVVLCSVAFLIVVVGVINIQFQGVGNLIGNIDLPFLNDDEKEQIDIEDAELKNVEGDINIYGEASLAELSDDKFNVEMSPIESDININDVSDAEKKDFFPPAFPREIYTRYDGSFNERLPKDNQRIIKRYFKSITS